MVVVDEEQRGLGDAEHGEQPARDRAALAPPLADDVRLVEHQHGVGLEVAEKAHCGEGGADEVGATEANGRRCLGRSDALAPAMGSSRTSTPKSSGASSAEEPPYAAVRGGKTAAEKRAESIALISTAVS